MKPKLLYFVGAAVLAAGTALAQSSAAPAPAQARTGVRARVRSRLLQELNLSQAQKDQTRAIAQETRQSAKPLVDQLRANREVLQAAVKANDMPQIEQLSAAQGELRGQLLKVRSEALAKFYNLLNADQRAKADQMQLKIRQLFEQRRQAG